MSWDDELRTGLDEAAELLPIQQTDSLAAAKSQGRKGVRRRRVLAASGGVLTASALLVGALSLAQDPPSEFILVSEPEQSSSACDRAFPTAEGLDPTRFEEVDARTWTVDGHTLVFTDSHRLSRENAASGESAYRWITVGDTEREVVRTLFGATQTTELGFAGTHLPEGCEVVIRLDAGQPDGGRLVVEEFEARLVWPPSPEPEPIVFNDPSLVCGTVAPFQSGELNTEFGEPQTAVGADGQLTVRWADERSSVEVRHPAGPEATETLTVPPYRGDAACDTAELMTSGTVSPAEARTVLRLIDPGLVDAPGRAEIPTKTSSAFQVQAPPSGSSTTTAPTTTAPAPTTEAPRAD